MLSLITNGLICGPQIQCEEASPCEYQESPVTNSSDQGPLISVLFGSDADNLLDSDFEH